MQRYIDGDRDLVWHELRQLGDRVHQPPYAREARAVCDEMARRARSNITLIVERLKDQGYRFHSNDHEQTPVEPMIDPTPNAEALLAWLEYRFGAVPMTLSSWVRIVGDVWLVGTHPKWENAPAADPLVLEVEYSRYSGADVCAHYEDEYEQWQESADGSVFTLSVSPDNLDKANVSGGLPYGIVLPDACGDAHIVTAAPIPLVSYLKAVFERGGFPMDSGDPRQWNVVQSLRGDLLGI